MLSLARVEMKMMLAALALEFEMELADPNYDPLSDIWSQLGPINIKIEKRSH